MSVRAIRASVLVYALVGFAPAGTLLAEPTPAVVGAGAVAGLSVWLAHHLQTTRLLADATTHVFFSARPAPTA